MDQKEQFYAIRRPRGDGFTPDIPMDFVTELHRDFQALMGTELEFTDFNAGSGGVFHRWRSPTPIGGPLALALEGTIACTFSWDDPPRPTAMALFFARDVKHFPTYQWADDATCGTFEFERDESHTPKWKSRGWQYYGFGEFNNLPYRGAQNDPPRNAASGSLSAHLKGSIGLPLDFHNNGKTFFLKEPLFGPLRIQITGHVGEPDADGNIPISIDLFSDGKEMVGLEELGPVLIPAANSRSDIRI